MFIKKWAGNDYEDSYYVCLMFFIPFTIDLIQNMGISILQARNQLRFRSILLVSVAIGSLLLSVLLVNKYGYYGCAFATGLGLLIGQGIILNMYYSIKQHLDIIKFWKEIFKMSIVPICVIVVGVVCMIYIDIEEVSLFYLIILAIIFSFTYLLFFYKYSMNISERMLFIKPLRFLFKHNSNL